MPEELEQTESGAAENEQGEDRLLIGLFLLAAVIMFCVNSIWGGQHPYGFYLAGLAIVGAIITGLNGQNARKK